MTNPNDAVRMQTILDVLRENNKHHIDYDEHGGYDDSSLQEKNLAAIHDLETMLSAANVQAEEVPAHPERILGMPPERRLIRLLKGLHQRFPDVDTKGFMNAPDSGYLDAIDAILKPAHLVQGDAELSRKLTYSLIKLMVGSCDCGVKSHEVHFHYENCMFRFYSELYEFIESTGKHRQPPASVAQIGYIRVGDIERIQRSIMLGTEQGFTLRNCLKSGEGPMVKVYIKSNDEPEEWLPYASSHCYICGVDTPHTHNAAEVISAQEALKDKP